LKTWSGITLASAPVCNLKVTFPHSVLTVDSHADCFCILSILCGSINDVVELSSEEVVSVSSTSLKFCDCYGFVLVVSVAALFCTFLQNDLVSDKDYTFCHMLGTLKVYAIFHSNHN